MLKINEELFGPSESCGHFLSCTMYPINAIIHPQRLYGMLKNWKEGDVLPSNPLFYEDMDEHCVQLISQASDELCKIADAIQQKIDIDMHVPHIFDFLSWVYYDAKARNLFDMFTKNPAYKGFRCPFKQVDGGYAPDFNNRYFTEDIPLGLCVYKGLADLAEVETPLIDEVLAWMGKHMNKEFVVDGKLKGRDVGCTHAPQRFGINSLEQLI